MNRLFYFTGIADNKNQAIKIFFYHLRCKHFRESYGFYIDKSNYDNASQWIKQHTIILKERLNLFIGIGKEKRELEKNVN